MTLIDLKENINGEVISVDVSKVSYLSSVIKCSSGSYYITFIVDGCNMITHFSCKENAELSRDILKGTESL